MTSQTESPTPVRGSDAHAPTVSIGLPVYNGANYLADSLDALLGQTYTDFEVIASDNASTDDTRAILEDYGRRDERIRVHVAAENRGAGWNFNRVLELARGRYFKWQAHDDVLRPTFLERCVAALDADPHLSLVYTGVDIVDHDLELIEHYGIRLDTMNPDPVERFREQVLEWNMCFDVFGLIRADLLDRTQGMGNFSHGDGVLLAHLALLGPSLLVDEPLFLSRQHASQSMSVFGVDGGGNDYRAYASWFDPSRTGEEGFPNWNIINEYRRTISATPGLTPTQRMRCYWALIRRMRLDARHLLRDLAETPLVIRHHLGGGRRRR